MLGRRTGGRAGYPRSGWWRTDLTSTVLTMVRRIAGMPDYDSHIEHLRRHHPLAEIPTQRQFYDEFLKARYGDSPTRCC
jgi:uncharacterized short protein YbdD (DUF466 family)